MARVMTDTVAAINVTMTTLRCTVSVILYMSVCVAVHFLRLLVSWQKMSTLKRILSYLF